MYRDLSLWFDQLAEPLTPRTALAGDTEVDVAIVGAGFTGLWTAYYLLAAQPSLLAALRSHQRHLRTLGRMGVAAEIEMG